MKKFCCALLACLPLSVMAYPIEIESQFNGAEVSASSQEIDHNMGGVQLTNYGRRDAECKAVFRNGPEAPRTRKISLSAGKSSSLAVKFSRSIIKLRVALTCEPV